MQIRDPKVDIEPYKGKEGLIDMQSAIENGTVPIFNAEEPPMMFD